MMRSVIACLALVAVSAHAEDVRIYHTDKYGNVLYHKPSLAITTNGRVIQTDAHGNKLYHEQQYQIAGGKIQVPTTTEGLQTFQPPKS